MLHELKEYLYSKPGRITAPGRMLAYLGIASLSFGTIGRFVTSTINVLPTLAKQPETTKTLADIYPNLPLWWVPESWMGAAGAVFLLLTGICVVLYGKSVDRMLKKF